MKSKLVVLVLLAVQGLMLSSAFAQTGDDDKAAAENQVMLLKARSQNRYHTGLWEMGGAAVSGVLGGIGSLSRLGANADAYMGSELDAGPIEKGLYILAGVTAGKSLVDLGEGKYYNNRAFETALSKNVPVEVYEAPAQPAAKAGTTTITVQTNQ